MSRCVIFAPRCSRERQSGTARTTEYPRRKFPIGKVNFENGPFLSVFAQCGSGAATERPESNDPARLLLP
jgi:hypothetical protein